jgi:sialate O-acetylesterase
LPDGAPGWHRNPAVCFNGKIAPIVPFAIKGVLWYQGESNVTGFAVYPSQMADLMRLWRGLFGLPQLPFIMTELAPYGPVVTSPEDSARARFGEALAKTTKADDHAWVITIVDGGNPTNIHPGKKEIPGERFAAMALAKVYGRTNVAHGPRLESWKAEGSQVTVKFTSVGRGLTVKAINLSGHDVAGEAPHGFELAGADQKFFSATARITGQDTVAVSSPNVSKPIAVRYAWANFPLCNLYNQEGFPAYPFRTDDWPWLNPEPATDKTRPK